MKRIRFGLPADYNVWWEFAFPKIIGGMTLGGAIIFGMAMRGALGIAITFIAAIAAATLIVLDYRMDRRKGYIRALDDHKEGRIRDKKGKVIDA